MFQAHNNLRLHKKYINIQSNNQEKRISHKNNNHNIIETNSIEHISNIVKRLVVDEKKRVLLVCDVDDTLIHPLVSVGSESWFHQSLKVDNILNIRKKVNMLYSLMEFNPVEKETNNFTKLIKELSDPDKYSNPLKYMCLTARNTAFHSHTTRHLNDVGYGDVFIRPNMLTIDNPLYISVDDTDNKARYIDNICSCSGRDKGAVLENILSQYYDDNNNYRFDSIIFVDDSVNNNHKVHDRLKNSPTIKDNECCLCIHYTFEEERKNSYTIHDFENDSKIVDDIMKFKNAINENENNRW